MWSLLKMIYVGVFFTEATLSIPYQFFAPTDDQAPMHSTLASWKFNGDAATSSHSLPVPACTYQSQT